MNREMNRQMQELNADMIREMNRGMNRQMQELKADMIREMNRGMNRQMQELKADMIREMNRQMNQEMQELKADMIREMNREMQELKADMIREMQELKADMIGDMQRLVRSSSSEWNVNARPSLDQNKKSEEVEFELRFANKLPAKILAKDKIKNESDGFVQIELIDTINREIKNVDLEIEIVVLDGDFGSDRNENWTEHEFNAKIVQQHKGKVSLLKGKQNIKLRKGVGTIDDLSFYDNSSLRMFKLGARVLQSRNIGQARIKEAISQAFVVQDHRTRDYHVKRSKKLDNEVSPKKKIKKNAKQIEEVSFIVDDEKLNDVHQGMQNANNQASPSHGHKGGFSTAKEMVSNLASQPLSTSTSYPVNAQGVQSISNLHPPTNGVSGRNSSRSNVHGIHCSPNDNPLMIEYSQINNGPYSHFPTALHASNAFDDMRRNAYSNTLQSQWEAGAFNNPTTGSLLHEFLVPHQVSSQNNNRPHSHISGVQHSYALEANSNPLIIPEAETYNSPATGALPLQYTVPNQGLVGMQNDCNFASSSQYGSALFLGNVPNLTSQLPVMSTHSLNNDLGDQTSLVSNPMTEYSLNNDGLLEQNMALNNFVSRKIHIMYDITSKSMLPTEMAKRMIPFMNGSPFLDLKAWDSSGIVYARCSLDHQLKKSKARELRSSLDHQIKKSEERGLRLVFANQLPDKIFTRDKIRDERDESVQIKLIDTISCETVELDPLSSIVIEIVVLDGDIGSEGNENWTEQEFNAKIVHQREGKGPLVKGKQNIELRGGVGTIQDLSFYDNSSWIKCGKFRLGARVLQSTSNMGQMRIKEAVSEAFAVNDFPMRKCHVERSKKLDPSLDDYVSPLKKIKKNAKCHTDNNNHTVRDFKQMHRTDLNKQIEMRRCLDSDREVTVQDASCVVDNEKLNASSNPILSQTTDPPLHYEFTAPYQGFAGMQNANNHASSSHGHKGGFSTAEEIVPNLASQDRIHANAQGVQSNSNFHPPTNGVSGRNSSDQLNERCFHCSPNYDPLMTESSQFNHVPHPHFPAPQHASCVVDDESTVLHQAQHASNAFNDVRRNACSNPLQSQCEAEAFNNPTTGSLCHESPVPHQESSQINNRLFPTAQHASNAFDDAYSNPLQSQGEAEARNSPTTAPLPHEYPVPHQGLAGMQNDCNPASSSQYMSKQNMALHNFVLSKFLTKSDITSKLKLPTKMVKHMIPFMNGSHFLDLKVADTWGKEWSLRYYTQPNTWPNRSKMCPAFTTGWNQYVKATGVMIGDRLIFSGHQVADADGEPEMQYRIQVTRPGPVTFNGEPVPLDVEYLA